MTQGLLSFFKRSLDIGIVPHRKREAELNGLVELMQIAQNENHLVLSKGMFTATYSFGALSELLYSNWEKFSQNPYLQGISFNTYQRLIDCFLVSPCPKEMVGQEYAHLPVRKGYVGLATFSIPSILCPYVYNLSTYHLWQADWYRRHPEDIAWQANSPFLPNLSWVESVIAEELAQHHVYKQYKNSRYWQGHSNRLHALTLAFHDLVMRTKGSSLKAYTIAIGTKICQGNAYTEEIALAAAESKASNNAYRKIFSITKQGKKQYISLDTAHGMFELHDDVGTHLGEFHFDGTLNSPAESSHNLKTL